jgi:hypothetical protein
MMECSTCGSEAEEHGVYACPFGPVSYPLCEECLKQKAHPLGTILFFLDLEGPEYPFFDVGELRSHEAGSYIGYNRIHEIWEDPSRPRSSLSD